MKRLSLKDIDLVTLAVKLASKGEGNAELFILQRLHEAEDTITNLKLAIMQMNQGPTGEKGDKGDIGPQGKQGFQGVKGDKGDKGDRGLPGSDGLNGRDGKDGEPGKEGAMGVIDVATIGYLEEKIKSVDEKVKNLPAPRVGWGAHPLRVSNSSGTAIDKVTRHIKFGSNLTTTQSSDGTVTVAAAGALPTVLAATGTVDDSNTVFVFTSAPTLININGAFYQKTGGSITWTGTTTVTLSSPVGTGGSIFGF